MEFMIYMMTSSNGNIFRVTGPLSGEFTGHRSIYLTNASDAELWCFLWSAPEQTAEQTMETQAIWDAIALIITSLLCKHMMLWVADTENGVVLMPAMSSLVSS